MVGRAFEAYRNNQSIWIPSELWDLCNYSAQYPRSTALRTGKYGNTIGDQDPVLRETIFYLSAGRPDHRHHQIIYATWDSNARKHRVAGAVKSAGEVLSLSVTLVVPGSDRPNISSHKWSGQCCSARQKLSQVTLCCFSERS